MEKKQFFKDLVQYISLNKNIFNNIDFIEKSKVDNKETILDFFTNIEQLELYYNTTKLNILKIIYNNRNSIKNILYDLEKIIYLDKNNNNNKNEKNLSYYFYVTLLIKDNECYTNYSYSINFIKELNNIKIKSDEIYKKVVVAKMVIKLIDDYLQFDICDENEDVEKIKNDNLKIISDNINIFNLNKLNNIDNIYIEIIISLIQKNKFDDYEYICNILNQLDLKDIDINGFMFDKIKQILNKENIYMNKYIITKKEDLFNINIINFYYIIFKFILKNSFFIYQIDLLLNIRIFIIKLIKSNNDIFSSLKNLSCFDGNDNKKFEFLIETFSDSKYYMQKYIKLKNINNNTINASLQTNSKTKEITDKKIEIINDEKNENNNDKIFIPEECSSDSECNSSKNSKEKDSSDSDNENKDSSEEKQLENQNKSIISEEIIQISDKSNSDLLNKVNTPIIVKSNNSNIFKIDILSDNSKLKNTSKPEKNLKNNKKYKIIEFKDIIGNHKIEKNEKNEKEENPPPHTADKTFEISQGFLSMGSNKIINIYNKSYKKIMDIKQKSDFVFSIREMFFQNKILTLIPFKNHLYFYYISLENKKYELKKKFKYENSEILFLLKESNNKYYVCCKDDIKLQGDLLLKIYRQEYNIIKINSVKSGIKLNKKLIVFKSCSIKNSILKFYNCISNTIMNKDVKGYSLIYSTNGLSTIPRPEINANNIILLCACKKYNKNQKNGILLISLNYHFNVLNISKKFFDTKNFEIFCFCPILIKDKNAVLKNQYIMKDTNYFFVGGFHRDKYQGIVKLYKIVKNSEDYMDNKIEFIEDINFGKNENNNMKKFKGPISDIMQNKMDGSVLITCWDGNVYLFNYPKIEYYLKNDEKIENNESFEEFFKK